MARTVASVLPRCTDTVAMALGDMVDTDIGTGCVEVMLTTVATAAGDFIKGADGPFFIPSRGVSYQHRGNHPWQLGISQVSE